MVICVCIVNLVQKQIFLPKMLLILLQTVRSSACGLNFHCFIKKVFPHSVYLQSFKGLPKPLAHGQREEALIASRTDMQPGDEEKEGQSHGNGNLEVQKCLPQRFVLEKRIK